MRSWIVLRVLVGLAVLAGCNQIYGLDPTQLPGDAPEFRVTGRLISRFVENNASGDPVLRDLPLNETDTIYLGVRTGRSITDIDVAADGSFEFSRPTPDGRYQLVLTINGEIAEIHHDASDLSFVFRSAGRRDPEPINSTTTIVIANQPGTVNASIASTGLWAYSKWFNDFFTPRYQFDWQHVSRASARHGLVDYRRGDVFYYFDFIQATSPEGAPYYTIRGAASDPAYVMMPGMKMYPAPPPVAVAPCSKLVGAHASEITRFEQANPGFAFLTDQAAVQAIPHYDVGVEGAVDLATSPDLLGRLPDINITPSIMNPIKGSVLVAVLGTVLRGYVRHPSASYAAPLDIGLAHAVPFTCADPTTRIVPQTAIGIPGNIRIDAVALGDNAEISNDVDRDLQITWTSSSGPIDAYIVKVHEVLNETQYDSTVVRLLRTIQTSTPSAALDPKDLVRGRYYVIEVNGILGLPDAATGDFRRLAYPISSVSVFSRMFRVK